ncbi:amidohydrolase family protein [Amycolatopsis sp. NBC_00438]|uniref:amidohydrolase family protein n=1 Tax=Amycolatopsis sp. NBC_00438 TaxID=2903558 RepID=UPI002E1E848D
MPIPGRFPGRFRGFAALATSTPSAAADELRRAVADLGFDGALVHANSRGQALDESRFRDIFEAYYRRFGGPEDELLATGTFGWHHDAGLTALRLIVAGVFDRFPGLQCEHGRLEKVLTDPASLPPPPARRLRRRPGSASPRPR